MIRYIAVLAFAILLAGVTLLLLTLPTPTPGPQGEMTGVAPNEPTGTLLQNVRMLENGQLSEPLSILMQGGLITDIGDIATTDNLTVIDGVDGTVLPGLIDSHTHSYGSSLNDALRFGVTTSLDMFTDRKLLPTARTARDSTGPTGNADMYSAGMLATAPGGHGTQYGVVVEPLTGPGQALEWVRARKAEGSDYIKLAYIPNTRGFPSLDRPTARAVIEAAQAEGLMALAHISTQQAARDMIEDGVDGLVHVFANEPADEALLQLAVEQGVFVIPTLAVIESIGMSDELALDPHGSFDDQALSVMQQQTLAASFPSDIRGYRFDIALDNVRRLHAAGVAILAGSDAPNPGTAQGLSLHRELQLLVDAGLTEREALDAATRLPAQYFGLDGRGAIEIGSRADLIVVEGNPLLDISTTTALRHVIKNGFAVERSLEAAAGRPILDQPLLGDFENGLEAPAGFDWTSTDDGMANGQSEVSVARITEVAGASGHVFEIRSVVRPGFPYPWAGGAMMSSAGVDISGYQALSFDVRGTPGTYRLMSFNDGAMGIPPTANFDIADRWQTVTVPLEDLTGADWRSFTGFAWVAGPEPGESTIYLDNVRLLK